MHLVLRAWAAFVLLVSSLASVGLAAMPAWAAAGDLDPAFGSGGTVTTAFNGIGDEAYAVALQPDGKIVAAGYAFSGGRRDFGLARYLPDGGLDTAFGSGGKTTDSFGREGGGLVNAVAVQPDGKIVAVGCVDCFSSTLSQRDFAVARFLPNGTLDPTFGTGGRVTTDFAGRGEAANAMALQPDGKIIAAGVTDIDTGNENFALTRYNSDGSLDTGFGAGGKVTTDLSGGSDNAFGVALQSDNKIVAAGARSGFIAVTRYNPGGTPDTTFSTEGTPAGSARSVALQPDGKIVIAGDDFTGGAQKFMVARFRRNGRPDRSFGVDGKTITSFSSGIDQARSVALQPDGKIVAAGVASAFSNSSFALARYTRRGTLDPTFGTGGKVTTRFPTGAGDDAQAVALQPDGKIVAAGTCRCGDGNEHKFALARYLPQ